MGIGPDWVAVDWGTSNLRAWGVGPGGEILFAKSSDQGMGKLARDAFPGALETLLADVVETVGPALDVVICGMAGARQGWLEAPYLDAPADLAGLGFSAVAPPMPNLPRLRALALFGRRPPQGVEGSSCRRPKTCTETVPKTAVA